MSKDVNVTETPVQEEKIVTRYDRKMQKRKEQAEQEKKEQRIFRIVGIAIVAVIACVLIYFPIRNLMTVNEAFIEIDGEKVTRVEFDYYYGTSINNYYSQYGTLMSYMGVDLTADLSTQMYSADLSWQDFFQQMAVESIKETRALLAEAEAAGFTYDTSAEMELFRESVKEQAEASGVTESVFLKSTFGTFATMGRLKSYVNDAMTASAYYNEIAKDMGPTEDEIVAYYEENKNDYDVVDYRVVQVDAELPTEPTELADPVEEKKETTDTKEGTTETAEEETYTPSDAEIEAAMAEAKKEAQKAEKTVATEGELTEGREQILANSYYSDWLFEEARKAGDTTIVEDPYNHRYYVVAFEKRYRIETPTANARVIITEDDPQTILDEWKSGAATEESFIELVEKYSTNAYQTEGGLYEGLIRSSLETELGDWLYAEERAVGDATAISIEDGYKYVVYYVGEGEPEWKLSIESTLLSEALLAHIDELKEGMEVEDPKGYLPYIEIVASLEAAAEESAAQSSSAAE